MSCWIVAYVAPSCEQAFAHWGKGQGIESYVPMGAYWTKPRHKHQPIKLSQPAFPGYVFVKHVLGLFMIMEQSPMFLRTLKMGDDYCTLADADVDILRERECCGAFDVRDLHVTDVIEILVGPLRGQSGIVLHTVPNKHVVLDVQGKTIKLKLAKMLENCYRRITDASNDLAAP